MKETAVTKPLFIERIENNDPELLEKMTSLREFALKEGALSTKMKTLMALLADALLNHPQGVKSLSNMARAHGASEEEIAETIHMAFLFGGLPGLVTATNAYKED